MNARKELALAILDGLKEADAGAYFNDGFEDPGTGRELTTIDGRFDLELVSARVERHFATKAGYALGGVKSDSD